MFRRRGRRGRGQAEAVCDFVDRLQNVFDSGGWIADFDDARHFRSVGRSEQWTVDASAALRVAVEPAHRPVLGDARAIGEHASAHAMLFSGVGRAGNEWRKGGGLHDGLAGTRRLPGRLSNGGSAEQKRESEDKSSPHDLPLTASLLLTGPGWGGEPG